MRMKSALVGAVAACAIGAAPAHAAFPGTNGRIAYQGYQSLGTINGTGGERTPLIAEGGHLFAAPAWSADGTRLAFSTNRDNPSGPLEIYVTGATGTPLTNLTLNGAADDDSPSWSPAGNRIVFSTDRENAGVRSQLFEMNADGSGPANISPSPTDDVTPAWSPDGGRIAFARGSVTSHDIFVAPATGGPGKPVTNDPLDEINPDWSPDGTRIVFQRASSLVVMNADGSSPKQLPLPSGAARPAWSPDGSLIVYDLSSELYAVRPDGTGVTPLTSGGTPMLLSQAPNWQPIPIPHPPPPPPPPAVDADHDGVPVPQDCNDGDPQIHPGAPDIPGDKIDQDCAGGPAPFTVLRSSVVAYTATYPAGYMTFVSISVSNVHNGDRFAFTCKGRGCNFATKTVKARKSARKLSLLRYVRSLKLRKGAVLQLRVTRPATIGRVVTWTVRAPKIPKVARTCLKPGAKKPSRCPRA